MVPAGTARSEALRAHAVWTVRRSWQHLAVSLALCAALLGWYSSRGEPKSSYVIVAGIGVFLVAYNLVRIARAREAIRDPARREAFAEGQRRSHRVRGRVFLVGSPILVVGIWVNALLSPRLSWDAWVALTGGTLFLAFAWVWWWRVVRRLG